jgi:hypothetical protein
MSSVTQAPTATAPPTFEHPADFYQVRDFGQKWEATAQLLRQHGRPLMLALLRYVAPWLLAGTLLQTASTFLPGLLDYDTFDYRSYAWLARLGTVLGRVGALVGTGVVYGFLRLCMHCYQSPGYQPTPADIWDSTAHTGLYFGKFLTGVLLCGAGLLLMIAPAVYVAVVLTLLPGVVFMEQDGLGRTFELVKGHWWSTAGLTLVTLGFNVALILVPGALLGYLLGNPDFEDFSTPLMTAAVLGTQFFTLLVQLLLLPVRELVLAFNYFSIVEAKESPGLEWRAGRLGEALAPKTPPADSLYAPHDDVLL